MAQLAGVTTRTLRYWEQVGLVAPSGHLHGGQRLYSSAEVDRVTRIRHLQCLLGLSLAEIRAVLDTDDVLDRLRTAYREGARADRQRRLLDEAIVANDRLIDRLDDTLGRIEEFRRRAGRQGRAHAGPGRRARRRGSAGHLTAARPGRPGRALTPCGRPLRPSRAARAGAGGAGFGQSGRRRRRAPAGRPPADAPAESRPAPAAAPTRPRWPRPAGRCAGPATGSPRCRAMAISMIPKVHCSPLRPPPNTWSETTPNSSGRQRLGQGSQHGPRRLGPAPQQRRDDIQAGGVDRRVLGGQHQAGQDQVGQGRDGAAGGQRRDEQHRRGQGARRPPPGCGS